MREYFIKLCVYLEILEEYINNVKFYLINNFFLKYGYDNIIK